MINLDWASFKMTKESRNINIHYYLKGSSYNLMMKDSWIEYHCELLEDADITDFETNYKMQCNAKIGDTILNNPFASKELSDGKKLYRRKHGFSSSTITSGSTQSIDIEVPYSACKINGVEFVNAKEGITVDLFVLDTATGLLTTVPFYPLNQFGFDVELSKGMYHDESKYDADLIGGMILSIVVYNNSGVDHVMKGNVVFHEVKL